MPQAMQPFLAPPPPAEQVQPNPIQTQGPFSSQLSQPFVEPTQVREPGYGGPGHALLSFANNFLAGAAQGRQRQFQQSERTKAEHQQIYDQTLQHFLDSPDYTKEAKDAAFNQSLQVKAGAGHVALGKGKGGKDEHPAVSLARSIFTHIAGPSGNPNHVDIGPQHTTDLIAMMNKPENRFNLADTLANTQQKLGPIIENIQSANAARSVPTYREDLYNHPEVIAAMQPLAKQGYQPLNQPGIQSAFSSVPSRPTPQQAAQLEHYKAETTHYLKQAELADRPIGWAYTGANGKPAQTSVRFKEGKPYDSFTGQPITAEDPRAQGHPMGPYDTQLIRNEGAMQRAKQQTMVDPKTQQVFGRDPATGVWALQMTTDKDGNKTPLLSTSPEYVAILRNRGIDARAAKNRDIRVGAIQASLMGKRQQDLLVADKIKNPQIQKLEIQRINNEYENFNQKALFQADAGEFDEDPEAGTPAPPVGGAADAPTPVGTTTASPKKATKAVPAPPAPSAADPTGWFFGQLPGAAKPAPAATGGGNPYRK